MNGNNNSNQDKILLRFPIYAAIADHQRCLGNSKTKPIFGSISNLMPSTSQQAHQYLPSRDDCNTCRGSGNGNSGGRVILRRRNDSQPRPVDYRFE